MKSSSVRIEGFGMISQANELLIISNPWTELILIQSVGLGQHTSSSIQCHHVSKINKLDWLIPSCIIDEFEIIYILISALLPKKNSQAKNVPKTRQKSHNRAWVLKSCAKLIETSYLLKQCDKHHSMPIELCHISGVRTSVIWPLEK